MITDMNDNSIITLVRSRRTWILKLPEKTVVSPKLSLIAKNLNEYYRRIELTKSCIS